MSEIGNRRPREQTRSDRLATGRVRYFNIWIGVGSIEPEGAADHDVRASSSVLEGFPEEAPYLAAGEEVEYLAEPMDPAPDGRPRSKATLVRPKSGRLVGTVSKEGIQDGVGVIEVEGDPRYFVRYSEILSRGLRAAEPGDRVSFLPDGERGLDQGRLPLARAVKFSDPRPPLLRFGEFPRKMEDWVKPLARLAEPEDWDFHHELQGAGGFKPILRYYLEYTFARLKEEHARGRDTILEAEYEGTKVAMFNTGLVTAEREPIIALFDENLKPKSPYQWWWRGFYPASHRRISCGGQPPDQADYLSDIQDFTVRPRDIRELRVDLDRILDNNLDRFPEHLRSNGRMARLMLLRDLEELPNRVRHNYKVAAPYLHQGAAQLLLPLDLGGERGKQDLALVVQRGSSGGLRACTVLGVDSAYRKARLIARPDPEWLGRAWQEPRREMPTGPAEEMQEPARQVLLR